MKICLTLSLILFSAGLFAQTKTVTKTNSELNIKETYEVLKSAPEVKNGAYKVTNAYNNSIICKGFYKNNLKDSVWVIYGFGDKVSAEGTFKDGKHVGDWKIFSFNGIIDTEYDFTNDKFIYHKPDKKDSMRYDVIANGSITNQKLDSPPMYLGGDGALYKGYVQNIRYPAVAREKNVQGRVIIGVTIDEEGKVTNYRVKQSLGSGCDEEAMRAVKMLYGDWLPGMSNGKPIKVEYDMPVNFALAN